MNTKKGPFNPHTLLWWIAIISLVLSGVLYYLLGKQDIIDADVQKMRAIIPLIGVVIAGVCLIAGTAGRWFYPK